MRLLIRDKSQLWGYNHMRVFSKATMTTAAFIVAVSASMLYASVHAENSISSTQSTEDGSSSLRVTQSTEDGSSSLRVTQSTEDGLEVDCEGDLNCEIVGDDTVVATSEDNNTSISTSTTMLNQSDIIQSENDLDAIDEQELGSSIMGMVNRLLGNIFAS
jgi:hypothetical protein